MPKQEEIVDQLIEHLKAVLENDGMNAEVTKIEGCNWCGGDGWADPPHSPDCVWAKAKAFLDSINAARSR